MEKPQSHGNLSLKYYPYKLNMPIPFGISSNTRNHTKVIFVEILYNNIIGYGEASLPPYLGYSQKETLDYLNLIDLSQFQSPFEIHEILVYLDSIEKKNTPAKCAIDMALNDLIGKICGQPCFRIFGFPQAKQLNTSYTISLDSEGLLETKLQIASNFGFLKVKLGSSLQKNKEILLEIRKYTDKPVGLDFNQAILNKYEFVNFLNWISDFNIKYIEQPMPVKNNLDMKWIKEQTDIPLLADESIQNPDDLLEFKDCFSGINIKLMKCGGLKEAIKMIYLAQACKLKIMLGCMVESSCGISAAFHLAPFADFIDLDGNLLIDNDPFQGVITNIEGKMIPSQLPGIGVIKNN